MKKSAGWRIAGLLIVILLLSACANTGTNSTPTGAAEPTAATPAGATPVEATATQAAPEATATTAEGAETAAPSETAMPTATQAEPTAAPTSADSVTAFPDPANYAWEAVVSGLNRPLDLASPPDETGRIFLLEQPGTIRILQDGSLLETPFLDISDKVKTEGSEQGLLGIAFHPQFAENGLFYLNYTGQSGVGDSFISRFSVSADDPNMADPDSEQVLLTVPQPYANHNGGGLAFGPDGYLYIALGDGGSANDPQGNAQNTNTHLGKLLRIDVNGGEPYAVPADNPFASGGGLPEIWAYGLRNPWRFSFDRATGDLYIADVGQSAWEEISFQAAGSPGGINYGWDLREGTHTFEGEPPEGVTLVDPVFEYQHGIGCSVTGGYVYRGAALPEFRGIYLFSDYCSGRVWGLLCGPDGSWQNKELFQTGWNVSSFGLDSQGELYLIEQPGGTVYKLVQQ